MLKKITIGVLVLLAIAAGAVCYLGSNLDHIVKAAIEKYGTQAIQTAVRLDHVKLSLTSGEGSLSGLSVANPNGFSNTKALYMGSLSVKLDTSSVTGNGPIVIREVIIEKPQVAYEMDTDGRSNLQTIQHNAESYAGASGSHESSASSSGSNRKVIINDLYIREGQIGITQALLPGKSLDAPLPVIHLTNIGKQQGGATAAQVAQQVFDSITSNATKVAGDMISKNAVSSLQNAAGKGVGNLGGQLKGILGR